MSSEPPAGPIYSADGYWVWDGKQWLPRNQQAPAAIPAAAVQGPAPAPALPSSQPPPAVQPSQISYQQPAAGGAVPAPKKGSCLRRTGCGCLVILLVLAVLGGGGYFAYAHGLINQRTIANALGKGTGEVLVTNFSDYEVTMTLTSVASGSDFANPGDAIGGGHPIEPNFSDQFVLVPPGNFALKLTFAAPGTNVASTPGATPSPLPSASPAPASAECDLSIRSGDVYRFVVINAGIVVVRNGDHPSKADDLNLKTSYLCKA